MITGKLIEIEPDARHQGNVHTQTVTLDISGNRIELFDGTVPAASDEMIEQEVSIQIKALPESIEKADEERPNTLEKREDEFVLVGIVSETVEENENGSALVVDLGCGTIEVDSTQDVLASIERDEIDVGDSVSIEAYRLDLIDIETV